MRVMRIVVFSDVHSNQFALNAIQEDYSKLDRKQAIDEKWFLGDIFGYGPHPLQVYNQITSMKPEIWLVGNNDLGVAKVEYASLGVDPDIQKAWELNRSCLQDSTIANVIDRPGQVFFEKLGLRFCLVHGFPSMTEEDQVTTYDYECAPFRDNGIGNRQDLISYLEGVNPKVQLIIVGHSHRRTGWKWDGKAWNYLKPNRPFGTSLEGNLIPSNDLNLSRSVKFTLPHPEPSQCYILNPGSVGFPNDGYGDGYHQRLAKYMIVDINAGKIVVDYRAVSYSTEELESAWSNYPLEIRKKLFPAVRS